MHENTGQKGMRKRPGRGETRVCLVLVGLEVPQPHLPIKIEFEDCRPIALLEEGSGSPPLSVGDVYQDPRGCLKPRIGLNLIYTMFFPICTCDNV